MHLKFRNVNDAWRELVTMFHCPQLRHGVAVVREESRNGEVMMIDEPVTITYTKPRERILWNAARDANPFLHMFEALWMLAGRNDLAPMAYYAKQFQEYSDDGLTLNGAYGKRWRHLYYSSGDIYDELDQLEILIDHLRRKPSSRRAVLQMWNAQDDLLKVESSKDTCCNLCVMFAQREGRLDMTVINRSNDMIWGALGANYVHFGFLQEYVACALGVEVGCYNQVTNNLHVYLSNWKPEEWLVWERGTRRTLVAGQVGDWWLDYGYHEEAKASELLLVQDRTAFDDQVKLVTDREWGPTSKGYRVGELTEPFLLYVAVPMFAAYRAHKNKDTRKALDIADSIGASDWRLAAKLWLQRRLK